MIYETPNPTALSCFPLRLLLSAQKSFCVQRLREHRGDVSSREMGNPWGSPAAGYGGGHELWRVPGGWKQPILPQPCTSTGLWGSHLSVCSSPPGAHAAHEAQPCPAAGSSLEWRRISFA